MTVTTEQTEHWPRWRWLKPSAISTAAIVVLLACVKITPAQLPSPGYVFLEITDEASQPVSGAAAVFYDNKGNELASSISDPAGRASFNKGYGGIPNLVVIRVVKQGYVTLESTLDKEQNYSRYYDDKIKLVLFSKRGPKANRAPRTSAPRRSSKRAPPPTAHSSPTKSDGKRAPPRAAHGP